MLTNGVKVVEKIDHKKEYSALYKPNAKAVAVVDVPAFNFLMIDGQGDPNTSEAYAHAVQALFSLSYTLKFMVKKSSLAIDYSVMPLEGLWWADDMSVFTADEKSQWKWTMMIMQPEYIDKNLVDTAVAALTKKKNLPALNVVRFESFAEGLCAQILHVGPFADEGPTVAKVHAHIEANGTLAGKHHEIYLSDIRRAAPEKWKTIVRQPMKLG
jgi:hypothetical protein